MMQDFSGQRLRGKSFRGEDLSIANFTRADLRGADFTRANLTGANFTQARLGLPPFNRVLLLGAAGIGAILSSGFTFFLGHLITYLQDSQTPPQSLPILFGILAFLLLVTLRLGVDALNSWLMRLLVVLVILVSMILGGYAAWGYALTMVALAFTLTTGLLQYSAVLIHLSELIAGSAESAAFSALCVAFSCAISSNALASTIAVGAIVLGTFIGIQRQDPRIHSMAVALSTLGGTRLQQANLTRANFSKAQLGGTDLRQAIITQARFYQAEKLDQVRIGRSILQQPAVQKLLVTLEGRGESFAELDLSGAYLQRADLSRAVLAGANLQDADLSYANLEDADLLRVNAIAANLSHSKLTGACVADWNIDAMTQLDKVDCLYLYLGTEQRDRFPSQNNWTTGEFTRHFTIREQNQGSIFDLEIPINEAINSQEILASLMVLVRLAIADRRLEESEKQMLMEAIRVLNLPPEITLERLLDDRTSLTELLKKINSPIIRERVYQSAYLLARVDGELASDEEELLIRIKTQLMLSDSTVEKLQTIVSEAQEFSIAEQIEAINDPEKRAAAVRTNIRLMSLMHAFSGAMPIPGFAIVTHLMIYKDQVELVQKIGRIWGYPADHKAPELNQALFGSVGATAARVAISNVMLLIPVWGSVVGASTAFSMTWAIGELAQKFFAGEVDQATLTEEFAEAKLLGQKVFQDSQKVIAAKQKEIALRVQALQADLQAGRLNQQDYLKQFRDRVEQSLRD
jgi:uncharacterized protein YjbI with pentapeptide repeats/uncharacterized protein (DUF697 family)/tellurite resistance protein